MKNWRANEPVICTEKNGIAIAKKKNENHLKERKKWKKCTELKKCAYCDAISLVYTYTTKNIYHACW